jgi:CotH kinase protein/PASTA domain
MYEPTTFTEIHLTLPQKSVETLEAEPEENYVLGTFSIAETDGTPGSAGPFSPPITVGIRLKGHGSLRPLDEKSAFKIKFGEFVEGQTFDGLEKLTLNNMAQDPSMIHETLAYEAFHALGVPAPHTGFSYLTVNGESFGMHLNIETQDKNSLEKDFGPFEEEAQHLYEGEDGADVTEGTLERTAEPKWKAIEVDEGRKKHKEDLEALLGAVVATSPSFAQRMQGHADLPEMTRMFATEKYIGHWDGYSGLVNPESPNNYYLYSNLSGEFQLLPWGTDQTWSDRLAFEGPASGVLYADCIADTAGCRPIYRAALGEVLSVLPDLGLYHGAGCVAESLLPWQEHEASASDRERLPYTLGEIQAGVREAREFISARPTELASFLGVTPPTPSAESGPCPALRQVVSIASPPVMTPSTSVAPSGDSSINGTPAPTNASVPAQCRVPNLKRKRLKAAKELIRARNCKVGLVSTTRGVSSVNGKVVQQSPKAGEALVADTAVKLRLGQPRRGSSGNP